MYPMKQKVQCTYLCMLTLLLSICTTVQAQTQFPALARFQKPSGVSAPGESFAPPFGGSPSGDAPQVAEWTRTAGPDESVIMTGVSFSRHSGTDVGKDTRFTLYSASGVQGDAQIQRLDGDRAIVTIPRNIPSWGMYLMWPGNDAGYGNPIAINKTDAWWVGPDKATRGATISVYGRNLSRGGDTTTAYVYVRSKSSGAGQWASVKRVNPYKVDFVVPDGFANGEYEVWAHNGHGGDYGWGNPINLTIYDGVKWTGTTYNVKNYGAKGDGVTDDTKAITSVIALAKNNPGATLYFPAGTYIVNGIMEAHSNNRWQGEGRDRTFIKCGPTFSSPYAFLFGNPRFFELNDLTLDANSSYRGSTEKPIYLVGSQNIWMTNVRLACKNYKVLDINNAKYVYLTNVELIGQHTFLGTASQLFIDRCDYRMTNDTDMAWHSWGATGVSMTNSTCKDYDNSNQYDGTGWGKGRFMAFLGNWGSSKCTYLGHNTTTDMTPRLYDTDQNSGEQFLFEGFVGVWKGNANSSTTESTTVSGWTNTAQNAYYLIVTSGRGMGQSRRITANNGGVLSLDEPWNVIPDAASTLSIGMVSDRTAIYKNFLDGKPYAVTNKDHVAAAGVQPYGNSYNFIVDNNTFHQLRQGTANWAQQSNSAWPVGANYFTIYTNNKYINCRVAIQNIMDVTNPSGIGIFGTIYRKNYIQNPTLAAIENTHYNFTPAITDGAVYEHNNIQGTPIGFHTERPGAITNQIFYNNTFRGNGTGYGKEVTAKLALRGNSFENFATTFYFTRTTNDLNSTQTLGGVLEAPLHVVDLSAPTGSDTAKGSFILWNSGTAALSWTAQSNASWLRLGQTSGSIEGEKALSNIPLTAIARGLAQGRHRAELSVTTGGVVKKYTVWLNVAASTTVPNQAPTAQIVSPAAGSAFTAPANITIAANASDADGSVQRVEFYQGNVKIGEDLSAPYTFQWGNVAQGTYMLSVKAVDDKGVVGTSQSMQVVVSAAPVPNVAPTVILTAPASGNQFIAPATVSLAANAADSDGTVAKVEFYQGSTKVGEDLSAPYTFSVSGLAAGSYAFTARAIDNDGAAATSQSATITVNAPVKVAPKVSVSTSQTLATQVAPASFKLIATATDSDGTITLVEFFNGTQKIGEDNSAPYEMTWSNIAAGSYSITAKATDNDGLTATSSVLPLSVQAAPQAPRVALTAPTTGANINAPATISIAANATDSDGAIVRVEFFVNGNKIGEDTTAPYAFAWSNVAVGTYAITAKATDNSNLSATSNSVSLTVAEKPNVAPVVSLIAPAAAQTFTAPATIDLSATATDSDGTISKVEFFANGNKIGEDLTAPYTFQWIGVAQGTYTFTVKATDNKGAMSTSQAVQVLVNPAPVAKVAPTVSLTTATTNSTFAAPANVTLQATAADTDGNVVKVEFYQGSTKIGEDVTAPYTFALSGLTAGTYSYTAKAIDNDGLTTTSTTVNIIVNAAPVAPVVAITAPVAGTSFTAPSTINIAANATDADGTISLVEFFANGNKIGAATAAPYSMSWTNVATGNYSITVKATDNSGLSTVSGNTAITVNAPLKTAPAISVTATSVTANVIAPATIKIAATATDNDGTVAKVEFFNGTQKIGEDLAAPFEMTWSNVAAGIYNITAKATDNDGLSNTSSSVSIVVKSAPVAPVVTLASSASSIAAPASVTLTANATDADGSIVKVEFFSAGKKLGEATRAPFQYKWTMSQAGTYTVTAKATDNNGLTATSEVVTIIATKKNQAPEVSLTKTQGGKTGLSSLAESVSLLALASDPDGSITKVEFFNNGVKVGETATSPYVYEVKKLQPGVHNFTAKATDDGGMATVSQVVALSVSKPAPVAPVISLGANKTAAKTGEKITLSAKASDSDGSVVKVEFFNGTTKLGEDQTAPFEWTAQFAAAGVYKITAKATDNSGMTATSNVVTLTVTTPQVAPVVDVVNPIANSVYVLPATISVAANATDKDGAIVKVEFFANGEKIGESKTAPFRIDWKAEVGGTYQITAQATDNHGLTSTAAAVLVTVQMSNTANQPGHIKSYPNPFSNQATLEVAVQAKSYVVAQLIAPSGQMIANIHQGILEPGLVHKFNLNGTGLPNGAYIVAIKLNDGVTFFDKMIYQKVVIAR
ncbi:Ig-like domain-containing protein [Pseudocnuella soli]|uniref:Ig-like domain-containing protein n=1 Tax=Pseudocnuella soli TaxID=2502779 RepID=UPI00104CCAC1|nr:Ig-like domain-containing protein [Pseudocnuella soli]